MISAAQRSTGQATLITGLLGSGKTWYLTNQILQAASESASPQHEISSSAGSGSLLAVSRHTDCALLRQRIDLERPLGCTKCDVVTFPSLVKTIVNDFGPTVGSYPPADAGVLDTSSLRVFLHRNLDALPLGKYRPLHAPGDAVGPLLRLFSSLAHHGISPEDYLRYVEILETELTSAGEQESLGADVKNTSVSGALAATERARLRAKLEAEGWRAHVAGERDKANSYEAFVALKRREGVADYTDQLLLARRILKESATAKAALSLRLSHIYADDLQGYSPAMVDILAGLVAPGVGITAAVDPYFAAISTWSNVWSSEHSAVERFKKEFPRALEVRLVGKRESTDAIQVAMKALEPRGTPVGRKEKKKGTVRAKDAQVAVESPGALTVVAGMNSFEVPAEIPTTATKITPAAAEATQGGSKLTCLTFQTEEDELKALVRRVQELLKSGVRPGDIGVAAVGGWDVDALVAALSATGVPVEGPTRFSAVFDKETPRMLMSFLRCLVHPSESTPLLHLLMSCPAYTLPGGELLAALEGHLSRYVPLRSFLRDSYVGEGAVSDPQGGEDGTSASARNVAGRLLSDVNRFAESARRKGVREVMLEFLRYTGQLERLEEPTTTEEEQEGRVVAQLFELVVKAEKQAGSDNVALVEPILRLFRRHGMRFADSSPFDNELATSSGEWRVEGGPPPVPEGAVCVFVPDTGREGVYRSFHTVFIPFCSRARLPGIFRDTARLPVPGPFRGAPEPRDTASLRLEADLARANHENRARATLYAALASARREVCFSVSARVSRGKVHFAPSPFLHEILGSDAPWEWKTEVATPNEEARLDHVADGDAASGGGAEAASKVVGRVSPTGTGVLELVPMSPPAPLRLSFSSVSSFAACPHRYYLQYILNVSPPPTPRMVYGRAMHEGVASFLRGVVSGSGRGPPPTLEAIVEDFNKRLKECAFESVAQLRTLEAAGTAGLESFLTRLVEGGDSAGRQRDASSNRDLQPSQLLVERKFMVKVPEAKVILSGIFDRVDIKPAATMVDVESSSSPPLLSITDYKSNVGAKDPARMVRDNLQLQLYALAAERLFGLFPTELAIESIEDGRRGVAVPSAADTEVALEAIFATAAAVRAENFDATPSFQACTFCGFKHMCRHSVITRSAL